MDGFMFGANPEITVFYPAFFFFIKAMKLQCLTYLNLLELLEQENLLQNPSHDTIQETVFQSSPKDLGWRQEQDWHVILRCLPTEHISIVEITLRNRPIISVSGRIVMGVATYGGRLGLWPSLHLRTYDYRNLRSRRQKIAAQARKQCH